MIAAEVGEKMNIKTYLTAHGSDIFELYNKKAISHPFIKNTLKKADVVFAVSEALKENILKIPVKGLKDKLRIHHNSVDISRFKPDADYSFKEELKKNYGLDNDNPILLFVGNLIKRKNVDGLIEAKKLSSTEYNLVIVGTGPELNKLKKQAKGVDNIYFAGKRTNMENIVPSSDIIILPSHSESFGIVLIEALACGKGVIGSNTGGISEIITPDVGLLIDSKDYQSIANAIDKVFSDEDLKNKFSQNARQRAKVFSKMEIPYDE